MDTPPILGAAGQTAPTRMASTPGWALWGHGDRTTPPTQPDTAVQLHTKADIHGVVSDGEEADKAGDQGRLQVLEDNVVGVGVSIQHLEREKHGGDGQEEPPHPPSNAAPTCLLTCFPCRFLQDIQRVPSRL